VAALGFALVAACATVPEQTPTGTVFELAGRVAVRSGTDAAAGTIVWRHGVAFDDLMVRSPLGQGIAEITRRGDRYTLTTADAKQFSAIDPEALTEQALGWRLPLAGLPDWVRGRPYPDAPSETRSGSDARIREIRQLGWTIDYLAYDAASGLPSRLRLERDGLDIRLTIDSWPVAPK
jgi:outer membrane lipoprotein LolB